MMQPPKRSRHRRTKSTITAEMLASTNIEFRPSDEELVPSMKAPLMNKSHDNSENSAHKKSKGYLHKYMQSKGKSRIKYLTGSKSKPAVKIDTLSSFAPILEENDWVVDEATKDTNGPSYLSALKFASVYNEMQPEDAKQVSTEAIQQEKLNKIKAYREYMQNKSTAFSRNENQVRLLHLILYPNYVNLEGWRHD